MACPKIILLSLKCLRQLMSLDVYKNQLSRVTLPQEHTALAYGASVGTV